MLKKFNDFSENLIIESAINESIVYFSTRMREQLNKIDSDVSRKLLELEGTDVSNVDITFIDSDENGNVTFITMPNAMKMIKAKYPDATNTDLDVDSDRFAADMLFRNDMSEFKYRSGFDSGVYIKGRNTIRIGKLVNKLFKGTLSGPKIEQFVNDFKATVPGSQEKIELVTGKDIKFWYQTINYQSMSGNLGTSCMGGKDQSFFNIYAENPNNCNLLIMTVDDKLVARALVWKLNSIEVKDKFDSIYDEEITKNNKPEYFMDKVYSIEDYQTEKMRKFAISQGWAIRKYNSAGSYDMIFWKNESYPVSMSVKVKKSNYDYTYPFMDTFIRYDHFNGLLWNDHNRKRGGHILQSTSGDYRRSISRPRVYINKFKDLFKK